MAHWEQDLDELGKNIQELIDRAVNSRDYRQLSQTVRQSVERAVERGTETVRRAANSAVRSAAPEVRKQMPVLYGNTRKKQAGAVLMIVGGGVLSLATVPGALVLLLGSLVPGLRPMLFPATLLIPGLLGGTWLLAAGIRKQKRLGRFKKYLSALGGKTHCTLERLARAVGKSARFVGRELGGMIREGLFLQGHMDEESGTLITSDETYRYYEQSKRQLLERQAAQAAEEARQQKAEKSQDPSVREVLEKGKSFLAQIRACNDAIPGERISGKISKVEHIVARIFERVPAHPEIVPDLKKMLDYYLPMTVKLLNAYAEMDAQPVQGPTITASKEEIEKTLDTLNRAFEKLLDDLFADTVLDISTDISVLNTLLAQDGLAGDTFHVNTSKSKGE